MRAFSACARAFHPRALARVYARVLVRAPWACLAVLACAIIVASITVCTSSRALAFDTTLESYRARGTPRTTRAVAAAVAKRGASRTPPSASRRRARALASLTNASANDEGEWIDTFEPPNAPPPNAPPPPHPPSPPPWGGFHSTGFVRSALDRMILGASSKNGVDGHNGHDEFHVIVQSGVVGEWGKDVHDVVAGAMRQACVLRRMIESADGYDENCRVIDGACAKCFSFFNLDDAYSTIGLSEVFQGIRALSEGDEATVSSRLSFVRQRCEYDPKSRDSALTAHRAMCDTLGDACGALACANADVLDTRCMIGDRVGICDLIANVNPSTDDLLSIGRMITNLDRNLCNEISPSDVYATIKGSATMVKWSKWSPIEAMGAGVFGIMVNDAFLLDSPTDDRRALRLVFRLKRHTVDWVKDVGSQIISNFNEDVSVRNMGASATWRHFDAYDSLVDDQLGSDCMWAIGALTVTSAIILVQTRSVLVTLSAICSILGATVITHAIYFFIYRREWFGVIHIAGIFVCVGIAADDIFVVHSAWVASAFKVQKRDSHLETLEDRMFWCISHSAFSVSITSFTTAVAFASNIASKIPPMSLFGMYMCTNVLLLLVTTVLVTSATLVILEKGAFKVASRNRVAQSPTSPQSNGEHRRSRTQRSVTIDLGDVATFERMTHRRSLSVFDPFPPIVLQRLGAEHRPLMPDSSAPSSPVAVSINRLRKRDVLKSCFTLALRWRWTLILSSFGGVAVAVLLAIHANVNGDDPLALWPKNHVVHKFTNAASTFNSSRYEDSVRVEFSFGVDAERSAYEANNDMSLQYDGKPTWLATPGLSYDFAKPELQQFMLDLCNSLQSATMAPHVLSNSTINCWMQDIDVWLRGGGFSGLHRSGLPISATDFRSVLDSFSRYVNTYSLIGFMQSRNGCDTDANPLCASYTAVTVGTSTSMTGNSKDVQRAYDFWAQWFDERIANGPPETIGSFQSSDSWVLVDTVNELKISALLTCGYSLALAFMVLFFCTLNLRCAALATWCIASVVCYFVAFMFLRGWSLGIIEAICVQILVGLSIDYISHIVVAYVATRQTVMSKDERALSALRSVGGAITAGWISTVAAAACLLGATIVFFTKFAAFIVVTLTMSYVQAIFVLPLLLATFGPEFRSSNIPS